MNVNAITPKVEYIPTATEKLAEKAGKLPNKLHDFIEMNQGNLTRKVNFVVAFFVILGARYLSSRDEHERREVLTRDSIGIAMVFYGVPYLKKLISNVVTKMTGFAIIDKEIAKKMNKVTNKMEEKVKDGDSFVKDHQIHSLYSIDPKNRGNNPLLSLCENLDKMGGHLKQIFQKADNTVKELLLKHIFKKSSFDEIANNEEFLKAIKESGRSESIKTVEEILSKEDNALLKHAKILKAAPELACMLIVAGMLGILLPWYNIKHTRKVLQNSQKDDIANSAVHQNKIQSINYTSSQYIDKQKELFANMLKK